MLTLAKIRGSGYKATPKRRIILAILRRATRPLTAQELFRLLGSSVVNRSTVYRTLQLLVQEKMVEVSENGRHEERFELIRERHHHHLLCERCGHTVDVRCRVPAKIVGQWEQRYRFRIRSHGGDVFGLCSSCQK